MPQLKHVIGSEARKSDLLKTSLLKLYVTWRRFRAASAPLLVAFFDMNALAVISRKGAKI